MVIYKLYEILRKKRILYCYIHKSQSKALLDPQESDIESDIEALQRSALRGDLLNLGPNCHHVNVASGFSQEKHMSEWEWHLFFSRLSLQR